MVEGGRRWASRLKRSRALGVLDDLGGQHLDGDITVELGVGGAVDLPHPPGPEGRGDPIVRQCLADQAGLPADGVRSPPQRRGKL